MLVLVSLVVPWDHSRNCVSIPPLPSSVLTLQVVVKAVKNCGVSQVWHVSFDFPHEESESLDVEQFAEGHTTKD